MLIRSIRDEQVYVVARLPRHNLQFVLCGDLPQQVAHTNRHISGQHRFRYFGTHTRCTFRSLFRVRAQSVMSHATPLHRTLLRLKARGSTIPDGDTNFCLPGFLGGIIITLVTTARLTTG
jgi:hypothetical protein